MRRDAGKCRHIPVWWSYLVEELLSGGGSETVEFKRSLGELRGFLETVVAFANRNGGTILIGVDDDGTVVGVNIGKGIIESLVNDIH